MTQRQIPLPLTHVPNRYERSDLLVGPSNSAALAMIDRWPDWPDRMLFVSGPAGSGKSHLGAIWHRACGAGQADGRMLSVDAVPGLFKCDALILDAVDRATDEPALFHLINYAGEAGASLLLLSRKPPETLEFKRADLMSRLSAMARVALLQPDEAELAQLLAKGLSDRQLGPVPGEVVRFLAERIERSYAAIARTVQALDEASLGKPKGLSLVSAREALKGLGEGDVNRTDA
jgi:chromosomal replication initiation ATPase DnaA